MSNTDRLRLKIPAVLLFACMMFVAGCQGEEQKATDTASSFLAACKAGNLTTAKSLMTKASVAKWNEAVTPKFFDSSGYQDYTLGDTVITDNTASVTVTLKDKAGNASNSKLKERKEDGKWLVYAISSKVQDMDFSLDFEHPEEAINRMMMVLG